MAVNQSKDGERQEHSREYQRDSQNELSLINILKWQFDAEISHHGQRLIITD